MIQSTITSKFQVTVPKEIRRKLKIAPHDMLRWEVVGQNLRVSLVRHSFLDRKGSIRVGLGSTVEDVRQARVKQGAEPR